MSMLRFETQRTKRIILNFFVIPPRFLYLIFFMSKKPSLKVKTAAEFAL